MKFFSLEHELVSGLLTNKIAMAKVNVALKAAYIAAAATVVAAIIAGVFLLIGQNSTPNGSVTQETRGLASPAIQGVKGGVTINIEHQTKKNE